MTFLSAWRLVPVLLLGLSGIGETLPGRLLPVAEAATIELYYAPEDLPGDKLVTLYNKARRYIYVAVYGLTFPPEK